MYRRLKKISNYYDEIGIFLLSLILRVWAIAIPINVDEVPWLRRSSLFIKNLLEGNLERTYRRPHPGVTNMWSIGTSQLLNCRWRELFPSGLELDQPLDVPACLNSLEFPISFYLLPRFFLAVITSACMVGIYLLTKRLLGKSVALIAMSLLLLEPFFLAYQRYITTDGLLVNLTALGLLLLLLYWRGDGDRRLLVGSGIFLGLAIATKIPAIFVLPAVGLCILLIELGLWQPSFPKRGWRQQIVDTIVLSTTSIATIVIIWPALWVAPLQTLMKVYKGLLIQSTSGNFFFLGERTPSPGLLFYPLVLAYRLSPLLQVGLLACLLALLIPSLRRYLTKRTELAALSLISLLPLVILSMFKTKVDRYMILVIPELALLAAAGWCQVVIWIKRLRNRLDRQGNLPPNKSLSNRGFKIAIFLAVGQLFLLLPIAPYYISYQNPLLGGMPVARHLLMLGQGEGVDRAAGWLNQFPEAEELNVTSWYAGALRVYFRGKALGLSNNPANLNWAKSNRLIFYINQIQRQRPTPKLVAYFAAQKPLYTWTLQGVDYVQIYPGPVPSPQDLKDIQVQLLPSDSQKLSLIGYDLNATQIQLGETLLVTLYWEFMEPPPPDLTIAISLLDSSGNPQIHADGPPLAGLLPLEEITTGSRLRDVHQLAVKPSIPPGRYSLEVGWFSPALEGTSKIVRNSRIIGEVEVISDR